MRSFEASLQDYRTDTRTQYEEQDGSLQGWPELSPEGKLAYITRAAIFSGATDAHFIKAVRKFWAPYRPPRPLTRRVTFLQRLASLTRARQPEAELDRVRDERAGRGG